MNFQAAAVSLTTAIVVASAPLPVSAAGQTGTLKISLEASNFCDAEPDGIEKCSANPVVHASDTAQITIDDFNSGKDFTGTTHITAVASFPLSELGYSYGSATGQLFLTSNYGFPSTGTSREDYVLDLNPNLAVIRAYGEIITNTAGGLLLPQNLVVKTTFVPTPPAPVPEPATWALMLVGIGGIGASLRKRARPAPGAPSI